MPPKDLITCRITVKCKLFMEGTEPASWLTEMHLPVTKDETFKAFRTLLWSFAVESTLKRLAIDNQMACEVFFVSKTDKNRRFLLDSDAQWKQYRKELIEERDAYISGTRRAFVTCISSSVAC
jgi:hypothetical protein